MVLIVCLDDKNGMLFAGRRQSMDRNVRSRILEQVGSKPLWMNGYSAGQFDKSANIYVDDDFLLHAEDGDFCFLENSDITEHIVKVEKLIIYRWNRIYPSDVKFPLHLLTQKMIKRSCVDFPGYSHELITEEIYTQ